MSWRSSSDGSCRLRYRVNYTHIWTQVSIIQINTLVTRENIVLTLVTWRLALSFFMPFICDKLMLCKAFHVSAGASGAEGIETKSRPSRQAGKVQGFIDQAKDKNLQKHEADKGQKWNGSPNRQTIDSSRFQGTDCQTKA